MTGWSHHLRDQLKEKLRFHAAEPATAATAAVPASGVAAVPPTPPEPVRIALHAGPIPDFLPIALHPRLLGPRGPGTTTMLPGDTIDGLRADGKRTVWTIEAGRIGNEKPITILNEVWSSPDLGITLRTRDVDPVIGEASYSVRNVVRGEPDAQLFRVPAEFAKVSMPEMMSRRKP
jgi:hypothetical protein